MARTGMFIQAAVVLCAFLLQCAPARTQVRQDRGTDAVRRPAPAVIDDYNPRNERLQFSDSKLAELQGLEDRETTYSVEKQSVREDAVKTPETHPSHDPKPAPQRTTVSRPVSVEIHTIKKGDTLSGIARRYGCSVEEICTLNGISPRDKIYKGLPLKVPVAKPVESAPVAAKARVQKKKDHDAPAPRFNWPIGSVVKVAREDVNGVKPIGIEITGKSGQAVVSAASGTVKKVGDMRGFGTYVIISHGDRYVTVYARLKSVSVREGDTVESGTAIAVPEGGSIHFEIGHGGKPVDPLAYLPKKL
ncbi:MAG: LysM peptidoglycan-binding domain-containing protein [Spirochaetes bacterium]|nr:MAG: LysM peptidoglycan-binding domain-containing protein [Spirochaetota bacterium]